MLCYFTDKKYSTRDLHSVICDNMQKHPPKTRVSLIDNKVYCTGYSDAIFWSQYSFILKLITTVAKKFKTH